MEHSAVTYTDHMCSRAAVLNQPIGTWLRKGHADTCEVRNIKRGYCIQSAHWCIEHIAVTDMSELVSDAALFIQPIGAWNASAVTNMRGMFCEAAAFDQSCCMVHLGRGQHEWNVLGTATCNQPIGT